MTINGFTGDYVLTLAWPGAVTSFICQEVTAPGQEIVPYVTLGVTSVFVRIKQT